MTFKCLTENQRQDIAIFLLEKSKDGVLHHGSVNEAADKWKVDRKTISILWRRATKERPLDESLNVKSKRFGNTNKKRIMPNLDYIKSLKFSERSTIERLSLKTGVSVGTVHSWVVNGFLKPHSSPLHPQLTDQNKVNRMKFCINSLIVDQSAAITFKDMRKIVHIDEKWFYLSRTNHKYYVVEGEELPYRSCKSKRYILQK
ncbi:hypothetical protein RND81_04G041600 [Saponaria officinalis]|uniref:DUF7769 domain-containing protein n=1 Tax=Saponaria officinalis TaxID=3572 RepID=A0AAW1LIT0_SAPOF